MEDFQIQDIDPSTYKIQEYTFQDTNLLTPININREFGLSNDVVEFHIISPSGDILETDYNYKNYKNRSTINNSSLFDSLEINAEEDLQLFGYTTGQFDLLYNFYRLLFNSSNQNTFYIKEISRDRTEIKITSNNIEYLDLQSLYIDYITTRNQRSFYSDFLLNFSSNKTIIGVNIALDNINNTTPSLYIKLYEPLPLEFNIKDKLWLVETISDSYSFRLNKDFIVENENNINPLKGPNFNIEINNRVSLTTPYYNLSNILDNNITSSYNQLQSLIKDNVQINIDYNDFTNFIHFSSINERINNFIYKLDQIHRLNEDLTILSNVTSSVNPNSLTSSILTINKQIDNITQNFDGYEYFLYYESGTNSFPKQNSTKPYINEYSTSSISLEWIGSDNEQSQYYGGKILEASNYDYQNRNNLWNNLPDYIKFDEQNNQLELLISMLGHHYDYIWTYIKDITNKNINDNRLNYGISKDIIAETLKSFGIKLYTNSQNKENIYSGILGMNPDGTFLPSTGSYVINNYISSSNYTIPENDISKELYKRIYHNLPYLLKSKGTKNGLKSLITCFGIPSTILDVKEYGGNSKQPHTFESSYNNFNYSLNLSSSYLSIPWLPSQQQFLDTSSDIVADTIEFRFKTNNIISSQSLLNIDNKIGVNILYTTSSSGNINFFVSGTQGYVTSSNINLPYFNGEWWNVVLTKETGSFDLDQGNKYTLIIGDKKDKIINNLESSSIQILQQSISSSYNQSWENFDTSSFLYIGGPNSIITSSFSGSIQEARLWINNLSILDITEHILNPKSFAYNNPTSSYNNLIFRAPLGSELDNTLTQYIYSTHPSDIESFLSASSSFSRAEIINYSNSDYLYNYEEFIVNLPKGVNNIDSNSKIKIIENDILADNVLSPYVSIIREPLENNTQNLSKIEIGISPENSINEDIIKQLGGFNIDDYIGDPRDADLETYPDLVELKHHYFQKYLRKQNLFDIIKLLSYLDNSLFKILKDFTPAKSDLYSGLIIKSHILERNKNKKNEPTLEFHNIDAEIDTAFFTGSNASNTSFNSYNTHSYITPSGITTKINNDNKESGIDFYLPTAYAGKGFSLPDLPTAKISMDSIIQITNGIVFQVTSNDYEKYNIYNNSFIIFEKSNNINIDNIVLWKRFGFSFINRITNFDNEKISFDNDKTYFLSEVLILGIAKKTLINL